VSERLRVGVVGLRVGTQHVDGYLARPDLFELRAVCDLNPELAQAEAERAGVPVIAPSFEKLIARDDLDIIDLCTPSGLHFAQTAAALRAGKHVVCEKPLAGSLEEVDRLAALERESGRRICPIFQYRFGNGYRRLLHLKKKGVLGKTYLATVETHWKRTAAYYANPWRGKWETELGGTLITHAIHAHDMLTHALGPVASVMARVTTRVNQIETEDCAAVVLELADGALASLSVTVGSAVEISRLRFCFETVTVESSLPPYRPHFEPWQFTPMDDAAAAKIDRAFEDFEPAAEHFEAQFAQLHAALTADQPMPVTTADSRAALELLTAIYHSSRTGRAVPLPIAPDHPLYRGWRPEPDHA
jgi:predicted dehydrogenase